MKWSCGEAYMTPIHPHSSCLMPLEVFSFQVLTYVLFATFHVVCKQCTAQLVRPKEAEVAGDFSGYGGGQTLEEPQRAFVLHDGIHHRPH